jgi:hypothetical protein
MKLLPIGQRFIRDSAVNPEDAPSARLRVARLHLIDQPSVNTP